ncbi:MAG TPA: hypothetical protein PKX93_08240 [bacterium]|nr:hypothetical protein [bacterium]
MNCHEPCWVEPDLFLMADQNLVEKAERAEFTVCQMEKHPEPVLLPEQPWEGGDGKHPGTVQQDPIDGSVLFDPAENQFHCWYRIHSRLATVSNVGYAVSRDGFHWEKPPLGLVPWEQSPKNNLVPLCVPPVKSHHLSGVVPNYLPELPARLIATVYSHFDDPIYTSGITFLLSQDGFRWQPHFPPTLPLDGDAHCLMWDPANRCYLCTTRSYQHFHLIRRLQLKGMHHLRNKRHIALARSRDLVHWTPMVTVLEADEKDPENAELYLMYIVPYGNAYLGLVQLFYPDKTMTYGPLEMFLSFSRNGLDWVRVDRKRPILPRGAPGEWDSAHVTICTNVPHPEGKRLRFWYGGKNTEHWQAGNAGMGTATLRRDGFACWQAGDEEGCLTTVPLTVNWATWLFLNVEAPRGQVQVEILEAETFQPLKGTSRKDCRPISGDELRAPVIFGPERGSFIRHTGRIRLRFYLRQARLYAFKCPNVKIAA